MNNATFDYSGSVVLVTGGMTGIGQAIARAFLDAGGTVAITGRRLQRLEATLEGYPADRAVAVVADVSTSAGVTDLIGQVVARFGRLDVVVSNAAAYESGQLTDLSDGAWSALRATNIDGFFYLAKAVLPNSLHQAGTW